MKHCSRLLSHVVPMQSCAPGEADTSKACTVREAALCEGDSAIHAEIDGQRLRASFSMHTHGDQQASVQFLSPSNR